jgi:iron complex outermembrane receptor protein
MKNICTAFLFLFFYINCFTQTVQADSSKNLSEVIVKAYAQNRKLKQTAAGINYISATDLQKINPASILPAMNATPGVRMEERSPGSYRMNIRGSTLRSPFGVRNVKIYWDEIPFTDPGGNTYLNQLGYSNFNSIEIIKGPGGSLYGAGTGGVILIQSQPAEWRTGLQFTVSGGSYGLFNTAIELKSGKENWRNVLNYSHQSSDGYRRHTKMYRDAVNWQALLAGRKKERLRFSVFYGDLYYQTPGALTRAEYIANPRAARPKAGALPSADSAKAAIYQKTVLSAFTNEFHFSERFENTTVFYGAYSDIKNPTFRNYEKRTEPHFGGRTVFNWHRHVMTTSFQLVAGAEAQTGYFNTKDYANKNGRPAAIQTNDNVRPTIFSLFAQADIRLLYDMNITAGVSLNRTTITIDRLSVANFQPVVMHFNNELAPRIALSKKIMNNTWLYGSIAKGFSPPTAAEILPSTSVISTNLQAEHGVSYELGIKNTWFRQRLYLEVNVFDYRLKNAIVQRKDANNADFFVNAGSTKQRGVESQASYQLIRNMKGFLSSAKISASYTLNAFRYESFKQSTTDYSGNHLPSVAPNTVSATFDATVRNGLSVSINYFYSDHIALNDANSDYAAPYHLLDTRINYPLSIRKKYSLLIFAGASNLFNATYSLGNDINAAGGRYYNVASGRSFYAGAAIR